MTTTINQLKRQVCEANLDLIRYGLVIMTWGNVSGIDREKGLVVIKPSGVPYEGLTAAKMVTVRLSDGAPVDSGRIRPSSDTPTHLALYRAFPAIGGVAHTHSEAAVAFAQARFSIPCLGTTHADHFYGAVPVTRMMTRTEVDGNYEAETGAVIVSTFRVRDPMACPAVLVAGHGPFTWGKDAIGAAQNSAALEATASMAARTMALNPDINGLPAALCDKHFYRKHGPDAYYGQAKQ